MMSSNTNTPESLEFLANWRSKLLTSILNGALIAGAFAIPPAIFSSAGLAFTTIYIMAYLLLLGARFLKLSHWLKSSILLTITFGLGLAGLLDTAIWGDSRTFMIAFIVFTSLLLSPRASWYALSLTLITYSITGWLILSRQYLLPTQEVNPGTLASWLSGATTVAVVSIAIMQALRLLQVEFFNTEQRSSQILESLRQEQANLENKIRTRTHELETRSQLFASAAQFAHQFSAYTSQKDLLDNAVDMIGQNFGYFHAGFYLLDDRAEFAYLHSASSISGKEMRKDGFRVAFGGLGTFVSAPGLRRPIINKNIHSKAQIRDAMHLPESRSQILIAIPIKGFIFGILDVQSKSADAFNESQIQALQIVADQLSLAIENALLTSEGRVISEQLETLSTKQSVELWRNRGGQKAPSYQYTPLGVQVLAEYIAENRQDPRTFTIPLNLRNQKFGTLHIKRKNTDSAWDEQDHDIIREIMHQTSLALENARLLEDAQRRVAQERQIGELTTHIGASFDVDSILRVTAQEIGKALGDAEISVTLNPEQIKPNNTNGMKKR